KDSRTMRNPGSVAEFTKDSKTQGLKDKGGIDGGEHRTDQWAASSVKSYSNSHAVVGLGGWGRPVRRVRGGGRDGGAGRAGRGLDSASAGPAAGGDAAGRGSADGLERP